MNKIRLISSGVFAVFALVCLVFFPELPFSLPVWVYILATAFFAVFPIKDMFSVFNGSLYKGKQFEKNYTANNSLDQKAFTAHKKKQDLRALLCMGLWLIFMGIVAALYFTRVIGRIWLFFLFAFFNFCTFFAIFVWCPFHKILLRPNCCMDCRIYNWDSFFAYSFLIFCPNIFTVILFSLAVLSLIEWEVMYRLHPRRFYKQSNLTLTCAHCDLGHCKSGCKKNAAAASDNHKKLHDKITALQENAQSDSTQAGADRHPDAS